MVIGHQHSIEPSTESDVDPELAGSMPALDMNQRSVLVTGVRSSSFVEFQFTVADPMLTVELVMPLSALDEFIHDQRATLEVEAQSQLDFARLRRLASRSNRQHHSR
jgi:Phenol hydroxylase subunit